MSEPQSWHGKWMSTPEGGRGWTASRWGHQGRGSIKYKPCQMENRSSVIQSVADADVIYQLDQSVSSSLPSPVPEMLTNHMLPPFHQNACLQKQPSTKKKKKKTAEEAQKPIVTMCDFRAMWFHGGVRAFQWLPVVIVTDVVVKKYSPDSEGSFLIGSAHSQPSLAPFSRPLGLGRPLPLTPALEWM